MTFDDDDDYPELSDLLPLSFAPLADELRQWRWDDVIAALVRDDEDEP